MAELDTAVMLCLDPSLPPATRNNALTYCQNLRTSPDGWAIVLQHLSTNLRPEVAFWCMQVLEETFSNRARYPSQFSAENTLVVRNNVLSYLTAVVESKQQSLPLPVYVLNKLAQVVVSLIAADYPHAWPNAFQHTILPLAKPTHPASRSSIAMFYRLLRTLDEDVTSIHAAQISSEKRETSIRVKDAMRDDCITAIINVIIEHLANPSHTSAAFEIMSRYTEWIDVSLVTQQRILAPMYAILTAPPPCDARAAASAALRAIILKRMDATAKLRLMNALQVDSLLQSIPVHQMVATDEEGSDVELNLRTGQVEMAALVNAISMSALDILKDACKGSNTQQMDPQVVSAAAIIAQRALPVALRFLGETTDEGTSSQTLQCVNTYVNTFSRVSKIGLSTTEGDGLSAIVAILKVVEERCLFPKDFDPLDDTSDSESAFSELRYVLLKKVFQSVARSFPDMCLEFLKQLFSMAAKENDASRTELALAMLLSLITTLSDIPQLNAFRANLMANPPACMKFNADAASYPNDGHHLARLHQLEAVSASYFDLVARSYRLFLSSDQSNLLASVLPVFFDIRGLGHRSSSAVRSHAAYSLLKLARPLRSVVSGAQLDAMLNALKGYMFPLNSNISSTESKDQMLIFETVGYLLGTDHKAEESKHYLSMILQPLIEGIRSNIGDAAVPFISASGFLSKGFGGDSKPLLLLTADSKQDQATDMTNSSMSGGSDSTGKDVKVQRVTPLSQEMQQVWVACLEAVLKASTPYFQGGKGVELAELRAKLIFFLHRMVDTIGMSAMAYLEQVVPELLKVAASPFEIRDVIILASQAVSRFGEKFEPLVVKIYGPIVQHVHQHSFTLDPGTLTAISEESREAVEMHRAYTYFMHALIGTKLIRVLIHPNNLHLLQGVVGSIIMNAIGESLDIRVASSVQKMSLHMLGQMVEQWINGGESVANRTLGESPPGFSQFVLTEIANACVMSGVRGCVFKRGEYNSGQAIAVLTETVLLQRICLKRMGQSFADALQSGPLSTLPQSFVHSYLTAMCKSDVNISKLAQDQAELAKMIRSSR